jgi:methylmalonyl-CoA mutase cobalamin-binding subunit
MPVGPGKYDDECTEVREKLEAQGIILCVIGGKKGNGFSVQGSLQVITTLPDTLEHMANEMRRSMRDD